jgi:hypothetical protein
MIGPKSLLLVAFATPFVLVGCAADPGMPPEPSIMVLPGAKKTAAQFHADENRCRAEADYRTGGRTPGDAAADSTVRSAALGTALGAGAGAAIGSTQGHVGSGAAIGAATGLLLGTAAGANAGERSAAQVQNRYDIAYAQCMAAAGNQVEERPIVQPRRVVVYEDTYYSTAPAPVVIEGGYYRHRW